MINVDGRGKVSKRIRILLPDNVFVDFVNKSNYLNTDKRYYKFLVRLDRIAVLLSSLQKSCKKNFPRNKITQIESDGIGILFESLFFHVRALYDDMAYIVERETGKRIKKKSFNSFKKLIDENDKLKKVIANEMNPVLFSVLENSSKFEEFRGIRDSIKNGTTVVDIKVYSNKIFICIEYATNHSKKNICENGASFIDYICNNIFWDMVAVENYINGSGYNNFKFNANKIIKKIIY